MLVNGGWPSELLQLRLNTPEAINDAVRKCRFWGVGGAQNKTSRAGESSDVASAIGARADLGGIGDVHAQRVVEYSGRLLGLQRARRRQRGGMESLVITKRSEGSERKALVIAKGSAANPL